MPCRDGIRLATRLWRPDPEGPHGPGPWPVLLMRQPYGRAIGSTVTYAHPSWYAAQGFLVAVQDVRGRGDSEGEFRGFAGEAADGASAVCWARRLEGANGRVGTYGFSYQGLTQLLNDGTGGTGEEGPKADGRCPDPFPDCLVPAMAGLDERLHWASEGGAHWWGPGLGWALQLAAQGCRRRDDASGWREIRRSLESGSFLEEGPALLERLDPAGMGLGWLRRDAADPQGWLGHRPDPELLRRPMLLIGGWHDPHLRGVLDLWQRARAAGGDPGLVIGGWTHLHWRGGIDALQLAFFRRQLSGGRAADRSGAMAADPNDPVVPPAPQGLRGDPSTAPEAEPELPVGLATALKGGIAVQSEGVEGWWNPGPDSAAVEAGTDQPLAWTLASDGRAAIDASEGRLLACQPPPASRSQPSAKRRHGASLHLVHDPWRPVPARGGHLGVPAGVVERGDLDHRADVACFSTAPQQEALGLLGRPCLELTVQADQPGFDLCLALSLLPAGSTSVRQLSTGFLRVLGPQALEACRHQVSLQPLAVKLAAGDRLRLSIAAAAWPAIAVNPGDGSLPWGPSGPYHRVISLKLVLDGSLLRLESLLEPGLASGSPGAN